MRGISASHVAALSQFTQAPSPRFPLYTHAFAHAHKQHHHLCRRRQRHLLPVATAQSRDGEREGGGRQAANVTPSHFEFSSFTWLPGRIQASWHGSISSQQSHSAESWGDLGLSSQTLTFRNESSQRKYKFDIAFLIQQKLFGFFK